MRGSYNRLLMMGRTESSSLTSAGAGTGVGSGIVCSGDFQAGATERFEKGADQFCTTNITESDASSILSTYDTAQYVTGTHSMSLTLTGTEVNSVVYSNFTGDATNGDAVRFYFRVTGVPGSAGQYYSVMAVDQDSATQNAAFYIRLYYVNGIVAQFSVQATADSATYNISVNTWYRVEIGAKRAAALGSTVKLYEKGNAVALLDSTFTSGDVAHDYWNFGCIGVTNYGPTTVIYYDNIKIVRGSMAEIGADE